MTVGATDADDDVDNQAPHPRATTGLFGHGDAENILLEAYRSGRVPHAWLIGGPSGIGKATLAYRMARFVLAHPNPNSPAVHSAASLALAPDHRITSRVAAQGHGDLLVLERTEGDNGKLRTVITVDQVRRTVSFFGSTASEGGWRICIVDTADELQYPQAANALLKVLEEPPANALLFLISSAPARLLPTIRSRCRRLTLRPLTESDVAMGLAQALDRDVNDAAIRSAATLSEGSVGRAMTLLEGPTLILRKRVVELLERLPSLDPMALHALGDALGGTEAQRLATFLDTINDWLTHRLQSAHSDAVSMLRLAEVWQRINQTVRDANTYNLERKSLVFRVFGWLAEAARG